MSWLDEIVCNTRIELAICFALVMLITFVLGWWFAAMCASAKWGDSWNK